MLDPSSFRSASPSATNILRGLVSAHNGERFANFSGHESIARVCLSPSGGLLSEHGIQRLGKIPDRILVAIAKHVDDMRYPGRRKAVGKSNHAARFADNIDCSLYRYGHEHDGLHAPTVAIKY
jgi:hypothetical protein